MAAMVALESSPLAAMARKLGDTTQLAQQLASGLLAGKGSNLTLPIETLAFASVGSASFDKLIEVNVVTKQMYLYEKGQLWRTYPISAGAPDTPTPVGQFKIYSKPSIQDMRGFNADGTKLRPTKSALD